MHEVTRAGSLVWDPHAATAEHSIRATDDFLPPFADLTSDEDREKKAESVDPGTYHVIANPSSFATLPEYLEDDSDAMSLTGASRRQSYGDVASMLRHEETEDPNTVILRTFEDPARRPSIPTPGRQKASPPSPSPSHVSSSHEDMRVRRQECLSTVRDQSMPALASYENRDGLYL